MMRPERKAEYMINRNCEHEVPPPPGAKKSDAGGIHT
jgi:hypothetical protein